MKWRNVLSGMGESLAENKDLLCFHKNVMLYESYVISSTCLRIQLAVDCGGF